MDNLVSSGETHEAWMEFINDSGYRIASILVTVLSRALNTPGGIPSVITFVVIENFYILHHSVVNVRQNSS